MLIKELLKHIYPSCKVKVYYNIDIVAEYLVGELYDEVSDDEKCNNWAVYKDYLAIFMD